MTQISPKIIKAAIVSFDPIAPPRLILFQFNPDQVSRSLQSSSSRDGGAQSEVLRLDNAPAETIQFNEVALDATDQLEANDEIARELGILPQLSALEILLYPNSTTVISNTVLLALGTIEIIAPEAPLTLLVWGKRVLPVQLTEYSATEEAHDEDLNPIRATLNLGFRVLSYNDFPITHPGYYTFLSHQISKEAFAAISTVSDFSAISSFFSADGSVGRSA